LDGLIDRGKRRFNGLAVADRETRGLEIAEFPRAFRRDFAVPGKQSRKRKEQFEYSGGKHSGLGSKSVSGNERAIPHIQIGHVPRYMTGRKRLEGSLSGHRH
jgi:hypothetical protein